MQLVGGRAGIQPKRFSCICDILEILVSGLFAFEFLTPLHKLQTSWQRKRRGHQHGTVSRLGTGTRAIGEVSSERWAGGWPV